MGTSGRGNPASYSDGSKVDKLSCENRHARKGFASLDLERRREISSLGGVAAHVKGTAHEFTTAEARQAGKKGGSVVSRNRAHMAHIGRMGGKARAAKRASNDV